MYRVKAVGLSPSVSNNLYFYYNVACEIWASLLEIDILPIYNQEGGRKGGWRKKRVQRAPRARGRTRDLPRAREGVVQTS